MPTLRDKENSGGQFGIVVRFFQKFRYGGEIMFEQVLPQQDRFRFRFISKFVNGPILRMTAALFMMFGSTAGICRAEVKSATEMGFLLESEFTVAATPEQAYEKTGQIAKWWESAHTYSGDAANLSLSLKAGESFTERLPHEGSVEHMRVVMAMPGRVLRMQGGLGPLQQEALMGTMTLTYVSVTKEGDAPQTKVHCRYAVGGFRPGGCAELAPPVDMVLSIQLKRLQSWIESPDNPK